MGGAIISLCVGQPGAGKSYSRVRYIIDDYLINHKGVCITNLPLNLVAIQAYYDSRNVKIDVLERIVLIDSGTFNQWSDLHSLPPAVRKKWTLQSMPVFEWLACFDLTDAYICLDEFHRVYGKGFSSDYIKLWADWFSEIRKTGSKFECVTQDTVKLNSDFLALAGARVDIVPWSIMRDPICQIRIDDYYQLYASITKKYIQHYVEQEFIRVTKRSGRSDFMHLQSKNYQYDVKYFAFYNSFQKTDGQQGQVLERWRSGFWSTFAWFLRRNSSGLIFRAMVVVLLCWLFFGGGFMTIFQYPVNMMMSAMGGKPPPIKKTDAVKPPAAVSPGVALPPSKKRPVVSAVPDGVSVSVDPLEVKQAKLKDLRSRLESLSASYSADAKDFLPVAFFKDSVLLKNGVRLMVGRTYNFELFGGKVNVQKIDFVERAVYFDNDIILRLR